MDPFTIDAIVLTLIATEAMKKVREKIGERGIVESGKLLDLLQRKSPEIVNRLPKLNPEVIDAEIVEDVKRLAAADPEIQSVMDAMALMYSIGSYESAEQSLLKLIIRKEPLGNRYPEIVKSLNHLASVYYSMGRYKAAEPLYLELIEISKEQLGDRHLSTERRLNNLAGLYCRINRLPEAITMMSGAVDILEELLGPNHPNTIKGRVNLAKIQQKIANK